jgi:hypothetical protein
MLVFVFNLQLLTSALLSCTSLRKLETFYSTQEHANNNIRRLAFKDIPDNTK